MKNRFLHVLIYVIAIVAISLVYFSSGAIKTAAALVYVLMCMFRFFTDNESSFRARILSLVASLGVLTMLIIHT